MSFDEKLTIQRDINKLEVSLDKALNPKEREKIIENINCLIQQFKLLESLKGQFSNS